MNFLLKAVVDKLQTAKAMGDLASNTPGKPTAETMPRITAAVEKHFEAASQKLIEAIQAPNWEAARDALQEVDDELMKACTDAGDSALEAARSEVKARFLANQDVLNYEEAQRWFTQRWKDVLSDSKRAKWLWAKVTGGLAAAAILAFAAISGLQSGRSGADFANQFGQESEHQREVEEMSRQMQEFQRAMDSLKTPIPDIQVPETATAAPAQPAIVALPPAVAAVAAQPLRVTVTAPDHSQQNLLSTVGSFYWNVPASQNDIEEKADEAASKALDPQARHIEIDHTYDLHSGEEHPAWAWQAHVSSGQQSWDGRNGVTDLRQEQH